VLLLLLVVIFQAVIIETVAATGDPVSPGGSGSLDDEWSKQMDELDRLRPVVAFDADDDERLVVDSFTDLPDVVIDDVIDNDVDDVTDDDPTSMKQITVEQVTYDVCVCVYIVNV